MVYGNFNEYSATGLISSRNPFNGDDSIFGKFLYDSLCIELVEGWF
jgi:hypothetical protein